MYLVLVTMTVKSYLIYFATHRLYKTDQEKDSQLEKSHLRRTEEKC